MGTFCFACSSEAIICIEDDHLGKKAREKSSVQWTLKIVQVCKGKHDVAAKRMDRTVFSSISEAEIQMCTSNSEDQITQICKVNAIGSSASMSD